MSVAKVLDSAYLATANQLCPFNVLVHSNTLHIGTEQAERATRRWTTCSKKSYHSLCWVPWYLPAAMFGAKVGEEVSETHARVHQPR